MKVVLVNGAANRRSKTEDIAGYEVLQSISQSNSKMIINRLASKYKGQLNEGKTKVILINRAANSQPETKDIGGCEVLNYLCYLA